LAANEDGITRQGRYGFLITQDGGGCRIYGNAPSASRAALNPASCHVDRHRGARTVDAGSIDRTCRGDTERTNTGSIAAFDSNVTRIVDRYGSGVASRSIAIDAADSTGTPRQYAVREITLSGNTT
jgi:hypothetical protein